MSEIDEPRWELLPHDPAGFFELTGSFDRKDLKRRYTDLIRRYKPEKHPHEFQRIRQAYEALDARLRYGQQECAANAALPYQWSTDEFAAHSREITRSRGDDPVSQQQPESHESARSLSLSKRLEGEDPRQLYEELKQRKSKSAYDYYALAVLADVVKPQEPLGFLRWILTGLKALPHEPALSALLYELLRQNDFGDQSSKVLLTVSQVVASDQFYYFTEALWVRLLKGNSAERFFPLLEKCEANLRDHRINAKVTFYVRILRSALWRASDAWIERTIAFLKENQDQITGELENELELNLQIDRYRRSAQGFLNGSPERAKIDRCIREFCTLDDQEAAERFVRVQVELAADSQTLLNAVPFDQTDHSAAYLTLRWIAYETTARLGIEWPSPDYGKLWQDTVQFMREVDAMDNRSQWQWNTIQKNTIEVLKFAFIMLVGFSVFMLFLLLPIVIANQLFDYGNTPDERMPIILASMTILSGLALLLILFLRKRNWFANRPQRMRVRKYQEHWRSQTLRFVQSTQYPLEDIRVALTAAVQNNPGMFEASGWLPNFVAQDFGLAFYALAHLYVR